MGENGHRENGRLKQDIYKSTQSQWLMQHQPTMKQLMSIMAERDAALQERNMALNEKNKALEERDLIIMQRDTAVQERNKAIMERDNALVALQYRQSPMNGNKISCPPGCQIAHGIKHLHHPLMGKEASCDPSEVTLPESVPLNDNFTIENLKDQKPKSPKPLSLNKRPSKSLKKVKREVDGSNTNKMVAAKSQQEFIGDDYKGSVYVSPKADWKGQETGLNQVAFDESTMPTPVCSCTGVYHQCYKWGSGGWQSACCTNTISMHPLPAVPNKRHARVGGRKMSGSAFSKLLSRLADEGHDLSVPVDLRDHWAKHGTNRYVTIR